MTDLPPRPPAPGQPQKPGPPGGPQGPKTGGGANRPPTPGRAPAEKDKGKKKGFAKQLKPTLIMFLLIAAAALGYMAVRAGRDALSPPDPKAITLPADMGYLSLELPEGWQSAQMGDVAGASARWAFGPKEARDYALFATRYRLRRNPSDEDEQKQALKEAEASLAETGGPPKPKPAGEEKVGGQPSFRYAFKKRDMWIDIWLTFHSYKDKGALYQFSCQSKPEKDGEKMRERCAEILNSLRFSDKAA